MLAIENNKLKGDGVINTKMTPNLYSPHQFRLTNLPDSVVIHYTAMDSAGSAVKALSDKNVKASAHLVISRDGNIYQLAPFNYRTWHAGESRYKGRSGYNHFSIGIEIDNLGWLDLINGKYTRKDLNLKKDLKLNVDVIEATHKNPSVTKKYWHKYTDEQVDKVKEICKLLVLEYPIKEIVGHDDIAPDRKQDPGPAFPMLELVKEVLPNDRRDKDEAEFEGIVTATKLNIRNAPNINSQKVALPLPSGTKVKILEQSGEWYRVSTEIQGWINSKYIK